ncbi:MAG: alpha/beta hydrolase [Alphaproteobacteria bacterium]|nr:alpha/beta hydrolase [Alphaproteobacteria bacterium]
MSVQNLILGVLRNSPNFVKRRFAGAPIEIDGNVMDANIQIMANMAAAEAGDPPSTVEAWRASAEAFDALNLPRRSGVTIEDTVLDLDGNALKARIYTPRGASDSDPAVLFFHQGGLVIMHHLSDDHFCSVLADECGAKVISLDYRLCPEVAFPAPIEDGMALWHYVQKNAASLGIDPKRVALSGDSAGGLISASMTHMLRDAGGVQPAAQCLAYPWVSTDLTGDISAESCSQCFPLNKATMDFFNEMVFPKDKNIDHPLANPAGNENLANLPPAIIGTAGFDPIRDQGNAYAKALEAAGNQVTHYCFTSLTHSYLLLGRVSHAAEKACVQLARDLSQHLAK